MISVFARLALSSRVCKLYGSHNGNAREMLTTVPRVVTKASYTTRIDDHFDLPGAIADQRAAIRMSILTESNFAITASFMHEGQIPFHRCGRKEGDVFDG